MCLYAGEGLPADAAEAATHFRAAARKGLAGAMFLLGQCHTFGVGVTRDPEAGLAWYRRAAEQGSRDAEFEMGECHAQGVGLAGRDLEEALRWWRAAARRGHARARIKIAHAYRWGDGVAENKALALAWYRRAAEQGDISARVWLGECYEHGEGVRADSIAAQTHYRAAAAAGDTHGQAEYGRCLLLGVGGEAQPALGEALLRKAADAGWLQALGVLERHWFAQGDALLRAASSSDDQRLVEAVKCFRGAAELGHGRAAFMLAECLRHGTGTVVDVPQAVVWYRKAAKLLDAKIVLGDLFYFGQGLPRNPCEALRWYEQAAVDHEDPYAMYSLGYCLLHGEGAAKDQRAAAHWLRRAALQGEVDAQYELGLAYFNGDGVKRSPRLAAKWLRGAARLGHGRARACLQRMERGSRLSWG